LSRQHLELAWNFAIGSGRDRDKFLGIPTVSAVTGAPILVDCLAWLDCRVFARLVAGDRIYYWADVLAGSTCGDDLPLTEHDLLAAANEQQMQALKQNRSADISLQRSLLADWRNHLPALLHPPSSS
jgi:flavin reductase (DIM6/NTAB) family NADH-FMN oxidoreductase RutF